VRRIVQAGTEMGLKLAGPLGTGEPQITADLVALNGSSACGHRKDESIVIPWPTRTAQGVGEADEGKAGQWFAGTLLKTRTCDGDCSYESFVLKRTWRRGKKTPDGYDRDSEGGYLQVRDGKRFACCKTAYRPYDVVVTAILIAAKRHFGAAITVASDGEDKDWEDGRMLVEVACGGGWAKRFRLVPTADGEELAEVA
jgi:hypothetical protein